MKKCKLCGGEPRWVYYCIPKEDNPDAWENDEPMILFKNIECKNCKATLLCGTFSCDEAEELWDNGKIVQFYGTEEAN